MYYLILAFTGCITALMVAANGSLARAVGAAPALVLIHLSGLGATAGALALVRPQNPAAGGSKPAPRALYLSGLLGVALTWAGMYSVRALGVAPTLAFRLLGQLIAAAAIDRIGLPGLGRRPLSARRLLSLAAAAAGCAVLAGRSTGAALPAAPFAVPLALGAGALAALTGALNASLGTRIGVFRAVGANYLTGLAGSAAWWAAAGPAFGSLGPALAGAPWYLIAAGGLCGVAVVAGTTIAMPRVSATYTTLTVFAGQQAAGFALDALRGAGPAPRAVAGSIVVVLALAIELLPGMRGRTVTSPARRSAFRRAPSGGPARPGR